MLFEQLNNDGRNLLSFLLNDLRHIAEGRLVSQLTVDSSSATLKEYLAEVKRLVQIENSGDQRAILKEAFSLGFPNFEPARHAAVRLLFISQKLVQEKQVLFSGYEYVLIPLMSWVNTPMANPLILQLLERMCSINHCHGKQQRYFEAKHLAA